MVQAYLAFPTVYRSDSDNKTVKGAPYQVFAISKIVQSTKEYDAGKIGLPPFYRVTKSEIALKFDRLEEGSPEYNKLEKWVGLNHPRYDSPRGKKILNFNHSSLVVTREEAMKLLSE